MTADTTFDAATANLRAGRFSDAEKLYRQVLADEPNRADALHMLGAALHAVGRLDEAIRSYQQALADRPEFIEAYYNLGLALLAANRLDEAAQAAQTAIRLDPNLHSAYNILGNICVRTRRIADAGDYFRRALEINPNFIEAMINLGNVLQELNRYQEATELYRAAAALEPNQVEAYNNLGKALKALDRAGEAADAYRRVVELDPTRITALANLALMLLISAKPDEAKAAAARAMELAPDNTDAHWIFATACTELGQLDEAIAYYRKCLQIDPNLWAVHSNLIYTIHLHPDFDSQAILNENRRWDQKHGRPLRQLTRRHENDRSPDRRLRIGYLSPDFRLHSESNFTGPLLAHHDHPQFEIFCYSMVLREDHVTRRLRSYADHWVDVTGKSQQEIADQVHGDKIDVLVDLTMHLSPNALPVFCRKPAPIQVCWLAYPGTTGVDTIDYRITDPYFDPPGKYDQDYSEKSVRLADTYWCYDPSFVVFGDAHPPKVSPLPAQSLGFITFGSLNKSCKVNDRVLELWAKAMHAVPRSRLILFSPHGETRRHVTQFLRQQGVEPDRVEFIGCLPIAEFLQTYHRIDIGLDPFPYGGGTTSCDALWMGVPIVTLRGRTAVGRGGVSILNNLGLPQFVADSPNQYVQIVTDLANDLPRLAELRGSLRRRMLNSPLMDGAKFAKGMEAGFRKMWRTWCEAGQ